MTRPVTRGAGMAVDIEEQPDVYARLIEPGPASAVAAVAARIAAWQPRHVVLTARGTSDHAALFAAYLAEIRLGLPAGLASPSTVTVFGARPDLSQALVVGVSQSGSSTDLVEVLRMARQSGALTLAVTNAPGSPLASAAELAAVGVLGAATASCQGGASAEQGKDQPHRPGKDRPGKGGGYHHDDKDNKDDKKYEHPKGHGGEPDGYAYQPKAEVVATTSGGPTMTSAGNVGLLNGTQALVPIQIPISICGNAIGVLGTAQAACEGGASATNQL